MNWVHKKCRGVIGILKPNLYYRFTRCKGTARKIDGTPYKEWLFVQDKNWLLLIHFVTLEIRSVLEVVAISVLAWESDLPGASFGNSCQYCLHFLFHTPHVGKYTAHIYTLSFCILVTVGHPMILLWFGGYVMYVWKNALVQTLSWKNLV